MTYSATLASPLSYYAPKTILITGATGFLGGVLLQTFIQKCPFSKIIILVRTPPPISHPNIEIIPGFDLTKTDLGIDAVTRKYLLEKVQVVFHCAANTAWKRPIPQLLQENTLASLELLSIFKGSKLMERFIICSTFAVDCPGIRQNFGQTMPEAIEPHNHGDVDDLITDAKLGKAPDAVQHTPLVFGHYAWTKHLLEQKLYKDRNGPDFPVVLARVVSIEGSNSFPSRGYAHPSAGAGPGILRQTSKCLRYIPESFKNNPIEVMPVDLMANIMLLYPIFALSSPKSPFTVIHIGGSNRAKNPLMNADYYEASSHYRGPVTYFKTKKETVKALREFMEKNPSESWKAKVNLALMNAYGTGSADLTDFSNETVLKIVEWVKEIGLEGFEVDVSKIPPDTNARNLKDMILCIWCMFYADLTDVKPGERARGQPEVKMAWLLVNSATMTVSTFLASPLSYYSTKTILVTGTTGFLGSVLLQTFIQKCPFAKIVILVRTPPHISHPNVEIITGLDLIKPDLGIDTATRKYLLETVQVVFHCAANTAWKRPIPQLVQENTLATLELLNIFKGSKLMERFMICSTFAVDCPGIRENFGQTMPEAIEPHSHGDVDDLIAQAKLGKAPDAVLYTPHVVGHYAWTKHLLEQKIHKERDSLDFPVIIARMVSIEGSNSFPSRGYAPMRAGSGPSIILHTAKCLRHLPESFKLNVMEAMPVDLMANILLLYPIYALSSAQPSLNVIHVGGCNRSKNPLMTSEYFEASSHYRGAVLYFKTKEEAIKALQDFIQKNQTEAWKAKVNLALMTAYETVPAELTDFSNDTIVKMMGWAKEVGLEGFEMDLSKVDWKDLLRMMADKEAMLITESHRDVSYPAPISGTIRVHLFYPTILTTNPTVKFPGVAVFTEIYQVTGPVQIFCRMVAGQGYIVACPESYHEFEKPGTIIPYDVEGTDRGNRYKIEKHLSSYDTDACLTLDVLSSHPNILDPNRLGATGMCLGGHLAFRCAFDPRVNASVCFFATDIHSETLGLGKASNSLIRCGEIKGETVMIFGTQDPHVPVHGRQTIYQTLVSRKVEFGWVELKAQHAFLRDELSKGRYDPPIAKIGMEVMLEVFMRRLWVGEGGASKVGEMVC
ncbi:hypothetical protein HDU97_001911 [Phlyctochytrium planicorne]|nr:hypothetical protein HDU97_001911 [Phlyctochytrium planicorne]